MGKLSKAPTAQLLELVARRGWRDWGPEPFGGFLGWYTLLVIVGAILMLTVQPTGACFWLLIASGVLGVLVLVAAVHRHPAFGRLTESGQKVRDHLRGLEQFIPMADGDRIAWLQGVESAPRVSADDHETLVKLYEPIAAVRGDPRGREELGCCPG